MFTELAMLLRAGSLAASRREYRQLIIEENCLGKRTTATRRQTDQRLSELYSLDSTVSLFRIMRQLWQIDEPGRIFLALLMSLARDPLFQLTAVPIIGLRSGEELSRQSLTNAINQGTQSRLNEATLDKVVRNTAASWTQSGHLEGRNRKIRHTVSPTPVAVTFALVLGYISGARGVGLFNTIWAKVLDRPTDDLIALAMDAKRLGYIDLKVSDGLVEVSLSRILTDEERRLIHGAD